jgi:hypothetical protein
MLKAGFAQPSLLVQWKCDYDATDSNEECAKLKGSTQPTAVHLPRSSRLAPPIAHDGLRSAGRPLDSAVRERMEPHFGQDLSHVRVHTDRQAARSGTLLQAEAYTVGRDIAFGTGWYAPDTHSGIQLHAHEFTHVIQQRGATAGANVTVGSPHDAAERQRSS